MILTSIYNSGRTNSVDVSGLDPAALNRVLVVGMTELERTYLLDGEVVRLSTMICGHQRKTQLVADTRSNTLGAWRLFDHSDCPCEGSMREGAFHYNHNGDFRQIGV